MFILSQNVFILSQNVFILSHSCLFCDNPVWARLPETPFNGIGNRSFFSCFCQLLQKNLHNPVIAIAKLGSKKPKNTPFLGGENH